MAKFLFETSDKDGRVVRLEEGRWIMHKAEKHAEVEPFVNEIKDVIHMPGIITQDDGGVFHLSTKGAVRGRWKNMYLEVVIRYRQEQESENEAGDVLAVHFNAGPPKGDLKWVQSKRN